MLKCNMCQNPYYHREIILKLFGYGAKKIEHVILGHSVMFCTFSFYKHLQTVRALTIRP